MTKPNLKSRRRFMKTTAAAAFVAPTIVPSTVFAKPGEPAPSDRVVIGCIGVGDLGSRHHLNGVLLKNSAFEVAAVCDVDGNHRDRAAKMCWDAKKTRVATYKDFRELCDRQDIDAVLIATPDHWHALTSLYAIESGKDVYCEKPLTYDINEGKRLVQAARQYGTVFQTGSQQRSDKKFRFACELVRNEKIGKLVKVDTHIGNVAPGKWQPSVTPPPELDWNFWLGPAPYADYFPDRCHYQFRWFGDYSAGKLTDWGAHHNDIAQWAIGADGSGPVSVKGSGEFGEDGPHDVPLEFEVEYAYKNGVKLFCHSGFCKVPTGHKEPKKNKEGQDIPTLVEGKEHGNGVLFTGTTGWIFVSRSDLIASDLSILLTDFSKETQATRLQESANHHMNFVDCIKTRERPICDVEVGHRSCTVCHLGNIAIRLGRELNWNPEKEEFVGDEQANRLLSRPMRGPWRI